MKPLFHKKPRSMPGFIVRVQQSYRKTRLCLLLHSRLEPKRIFLSCARAVKGNENKRFLLCFFPPTPGWNQSAFSVLSPARAHEGKWGQAAVFLPAPRLEPKQARFLFCVRSDEKENKRLCFFPSPTRFRLDLNQGAFSVLRARSAVAPFETSGFFSLARRFLRTGARAKIREHEHGQAGGTGAGATTRRPGRSKQIDTPKQEEPCVMNGYPGVASGCTSQQGTMKLHPGSVR